MTPRPSIQERVDLQNDSDGIKFSRNATSYKFCTWSDTGIEGRDENYVFPCSTDLDCCGRECCEHAPIMPLWLILLLIALLLLLLCICCGLAAWIWYKCRPKKDKPLTNGVYVAVPNRDKNVVYSSDTPVFIQTSRNHAHNRTTMLDSPSDAPPSQSTEPQSERSLTLRRAASEMSDSTLDDGSLPKTGPLLHEKFVPSPMEETFVPPPKPIPVKRHTEDEISRQQRPLLSNADAPDQQRAQIAFYRPFIPDKMEEVVIPNPVHLKVDYHDSSDITTAKFAKISTIERPKPIKPQTIFYRPGFDNVPAY